MHRCFQVVTAVVVLWISLSGWADDGANETSFIDRIQGEWIVDSMKFADIVIRGTVEKPIRMSFSKDKMLIRPGIDASSNAWFSIGSDGFDSSKDVTLVFKEGDQTMALEVDETQTPVQLVLKEKKKGDVLTRRAICRLKGEDLELCIALKDLHRPTDFIATKSAILFQLKREAVKK